MHATSRSLIAGTATRYLLLLLNIVAGALLMPFTIHHLGAAQYGLWMLVASMTTYFQLLDIGYGNGIVRHIVEADARGDAGEMNCVVSTFVCVYAAIGIAVLGITAALMAWVLPRFPHLNAADVATARIVIAILATRVAIGFPMTVFGAVTNARQGFVLNNVVAIAVVIANAVVTYGLLRSGYGIVPLVAATALVNILGYVGYAATARRVFPALRITPRLFRADRWREVTAFSVWMFVIDIAVQIGFNIDNVVIGAAMSTAAIAVYAVALRLAEYQRRFCDQFSGMLFPVAVSMGARRDTERLRAIMIDGTRVTTVLGCGAMLCLVALGGPLVRAWMGPGFEGGTGALAALATATAIVVAHAPMNKVLIALGRHRMVAAIWIAESAANLLLSVVLVRYWGLTGVAVGTAIPLAIGHLFFILPAAARAVDLEVGGALRLMFAPALSGILPAAAAAAVIRVTVIGPVPIAVVAVEIAVTLLAYSIGVMGLGIDRQTRTQYWNRIRAMRMNRLSAVAAIDPSVRC